MDRRGSATPIGASSAAAPVDQHEPPTATVAIAHDYLTQRGGAERVVLAMARAFPGSPVLTSLYDAAGTYPEFAELPLLSTPIDRYDLLRHRHRIALPLLAKTFSSLVAPADVVVCSSSGWAHGVRTEGRKVVYCYNPARWLYQREQYGPANNPIARLGMGALNNRLRAWDRRAALSADRYIAISRAVRDRVRTTYGIDAELLHPPVTLDPAAPRDPLPYDTGFVLCVSRLMSYKNVHLAVEAMKSLPDSRLVVVGTGPEAQRLHESAPANVELVGEVTDAELRWLYANASALVSSSYEDFGLTPVEAATFGTPSVLLRWGGFLDTLDEGVTGEYFDEPTPDAIADSLKSVLDRSWDEAVIRDHAQSFSEERFTERLRGIVAEEAGQQYGIDEPDDRPVLRPLPAAGHQEATAVPNLRGTATKVSVVAADAATLTLAFAAAFAIWSGWRVESSDSFRSDHFALGAIAVPLWIAGFSRHGLYRHRLVANRLEEFRRMVKGATLGMIGTAAVAGVTRLNGARLWYLLAAALGIAFVAIERDLMRRAFRRSRERGRRRRSVLIIGTDEQAGELAQMFDGNVALGYQVVGFLSDDLALGSSVEGESKVLGRTADAAAIVRRTGATGVVVAPSALDSEAEAQLIRTLTALGVHIEIAMALNDIAPQRVTVRPVGRFPLMHVEPAKRSLAKSATKRAFDVGGALLAVVVLAPLMGLAALTVKLESRGPIIERHRRVGRHGQRFDARKLRTHHLTGETVLDLRFGSEGQEIVEPRTTRIGRVLRRISLDEVPLLWNVLRGEMSFVGPRPVLEHEISSWTPDDHSRLRFRPGITGMWQVHGRGDLTFEDYEQLDLYYAENWTLFTDLAIIARTVPAIVATKGTY